jgi:hypothetical protein
MEVTVMTPDFEDVLVIDRYESLIWTQRFQAYGDFELYLPVDPELLSVLSVNSYLRISESDCVMIVENIEFKTDEEEGDHLIISGRSLESLLTRRIVWPQTVLNGNVQNAIKKLVEQNIGVSASAERKISNFIFSPSNDQAITSLDDLRAQFTGDSLYEAIRAICEVYGLGFKVILSQENNFVFSLYPGVDRTSEQSVNDPVIFSPEYDTLLGSNYRSSTESLKTVAIVAGEGEGADRKHTTATLVETNAIYRRELYVDARDISSTIEGDTLSDEDYTYLLEQRGIERLAETLSDVEFDTSPVIGRQFVFRQDYNVGDIVEMENAYGIGGSFRVTEAIISDDSDGYKVYPSFAAITT